MASRFDIAVVGAGIAGASIAAELSAAGASVLLLEAEDQPGYHATGRSAAFWTESYGGPMVQPLTTASGPALRAGGYLSARGALTIARLGQESALQAFAAGYVTQGVRIEIIHGEALGGYIPGLRPVWTMGALEPDCCDIDVARLHQDYLARARRNSAELWTRARLREAQCNAQGWHLRLEDGRQTAAGLLLNAAGAWADAVAACAGIATIGLSPLRRTIAQLRMNPAPPADLPLVLDLGEQFYFKSEAGRLWLSPHDETPSPPCDAAPEELAVAEAIDRLGTVVDWQVERIEHRWAGLRTFAPDRLPVYGFDPAEPRFFWFAGQGGFGIQTAPAAAQLATQIITGSPGGTIDPKPYDPARFGRSWPKGCSAL